MVPASVAGVRRWALRGALPNKGSNTMKRILCAALALTLFSSTAASAHDWDQHGWHGGRGVGAAVALGLGILTLGILASESAHEHDRYRDGYDNRDGGRDRYGDAYRDSPDSRDRAYDNRNNDSRSNGENNTDGDGAYDGNR
jgi:hypothetical protein